jgi:Anabaena sensory rhodopsin transducer
MTSHDTAYMLNPNDKPAEIAITVYFRDREPADPYRATIPARRVLHQRFDDLNDPEPSRMAWTTRIDPLVGAHSRPEHSPGLQGGGERPDVDHRVPGWINTSPTPQDGVLPVLEQARVLHLSRIHDPATAHPGLSRWPLPGCSPQRLPSAPAPQTKHSRPCGTPSPGRPEDFARDPPLSLLFSSGMKGSDSGAELQRAQDKMANMRGPRWRPRRAAPVRSARRRRRRHRRHPAGARRSRVGRGGG